ncbi:bacteriocin leader domain-containing protein [Dictyobacter halimunensis]
MKTKGVNHVEFWKKQADVSEQVLEEVSDEQLRQVSGGSLLHAGTQLNVVDGILGNVVTTATQTVGSVGVSGVQVQAAGVNVSTPAIVPETLL